MMKALLCFLAGLGVTGMSIKDRLDQRALDQRGLVAIAEPLKEYTTVTSRRTGAVKYYTADVYFTTAAGERIRTNQILSANSIGRINRGKQEIRYLPDKPTVNHFADRRDPSSENLIIGLLLSLFGGIWFWRRLHAPD